MSKEAEDKTEIATSTFQELDAKDENQILAEMRGEFLQQYVYSFKQGNREITNLSYVGVKEAIRRRGHVEIIEQKIEEANGKIRALVKVHDCINDIDVLGASEAEADKPFAYVLAVNKAERNAFSKIIPAKFFAELISEKLHGKQGQPKEAPKNVTPKPDEQVPVSYQIEAELPAELTAQLTFDEEGKTLIVKAKQRLETDDFKTVCRVVEGFGGKYISDKENTRWEVSIDV